MNRILLLLLVLCACETNHFDSDKRQLLAKDSIRVKLKRPYSNFNIHSFKEVSESGEQPNSTGQTLVYSLQFSYTDSTGNNLQKTGQVHFARQGTTVLSTEILDSKVQ